MLGQLREKVEGIKQVDILFEVLRVCGVEQNLPLEWLEADFLERYGWPCDVLGKALLGGLVKDANAVVDAEAGMLPGQEVPGKVLVQEFALYQEVDNPTAEYLDHGVQPRERYVEERTFIIEAALQNDGVEMRVPPQHVLRRSDGR